MRAGKWLAVCCAVLWAQGARAQEAESPLAARWSVGAGLGWSGVSFASTAPMLGGTLLGSLGGLGVFSGRTSLEYLLSEDLALVLGGAGSYTHATVEVSTAEVQPEPADTYTLSANLGLRKYLAGSGATRFSVHGLLNAGLAHRKGYPGSLSGSTVEDRGGSVFLSAGFAVDRTLLERLGVRVGVDVLSVGRSSTRQTLPPVAGEPGPEFHSAVTGVAFFLAPSLELRLAF